MKSFLLIIVSIISITGFTQRTHAYVFGGAANYQGELLFGVSATKRFSLSQARFAGGIGVEHELSPHFSLRGGVTIGKIGADDKKSGIDLARNLNFTSSITDVFAGVQFYLTDPSLHVINPYIFTGICAFHFNPYTTDSLGAKVFLKPLSTEGQGFIPGRQPYKLTQIAFPFGGGLKFALGDDLRIGLEVSFRRTFTDYLDDVSTFYVDQDLLRANRGQRAVDFAYRGDEIKNGTPYPAAGTDRGIARFKDWYYFTGVTVAIRLRSGEERGSRGRIGCPTRF